MWRCCGVCPNLLLSQKAGWFHNPPSQKLFMPVLSCESFPLNYASTRRRIVLYLLVAGDD